MLLSATLLTMTPGPATRAIGFRQRAGHRHFR
jgi:hypothetical protein